MHLITEQHGAYLLLLFLPWRLSIVPDDDATLARITVQHASGWSSDRPAIFFQIRGERWYHGREPERTRTETKHKSNFRKANSAASRIWAALTQTPTASRRIGLVVPCTPCETLLPLPEDAMKLEPRLACTDLYTNRTATKPAQVRQRNLGSAIFLVALVDYHSLQAEVHESAAKFLYPKTSEWQTHYDWAVALAGGLNPAWLRDVLDRCKAKWDVQRSARMHFTKPLRSAAKQRRPAHGIRKCS